MATVSELVNRMTLSEPEFHLPPELWELVFAHLAGKRVLVLRLVCRRWKTIVDRKRSLWDMLSVCVYGRTTDERFRPESLPPVTGFCVQKSTIEHVDSWWPSFGERLTRITLESGHVTLNLVVGMLRHTPNLTHLHLSRFIRETSEEEPAVDFQLERMEELYLKYSIIDAFVEMFPRLRKLQTDFIQQYQDITARLMNFVQGTLEELDFKATPYLMKEIAKMERLKLKIARFNYGCQFAVQLSRIQPSLEEIFVAMVSTPDLSEIAENLPNLKQLSVVVDRQGLLEPLFLANTRQLQILALQSYYSTMQLNFGPLKCPYLVELKLHQFHLVANSLPTFLAGSKNLQKLSLDSCVLESVLSFFTTLAELPSLRHLELKNPRVLNKDFNISTFQLTTNLESLHLNYCENLTHEMVNWLATSSCRVSEVRLDYMFQVNDATILNLCLKLPRLKKLALLNCSVMITSAEHIVNHAHSLDYLEINGFFEFRQAVEKLIKGHHRYIECKMRF